MKDKQSKKIGPYLKALRLKAGFSLRQVEERTGISNAYLSQIENLNRQASLEILVELACFYRHDFKILLQQSGRYPKLENIIRKYSVANDMGRFTLNFLCRETGLDYDRSLLKKDEFHEWPSWSIYYKGKADMALSLCLLVKKTRLAYMKYLRDKMIINLKRLEEVRR